MILFLGFKFSDRKQESECKYSMSSGAGVRVTFFGKGARVKKVTPNTSASAFQTPR